jgi:hypothetical protein
MAIFNVGNRIIEPGMWPWGYVEAKNENPLTSPPFVEIGASCYAESGSLLETPTGSAARTVEILVAGDGVFYVAYGVDVAGGRFSIFGDFADQTVGLGINGANIIYNAEGLIPGSLYRISISISSGAALSAAKIYINGSLLTSLHSSINSTETFNTSAGVFRLNRDISGVFAVANIYKDVRVWDYERTATQIQQAAFVYVDKESPGLVYNWRINEGVGLTFIDNVGSNHMTADSATWIMTL